MVAPRRCTVSLCMIVRNEERNLAACLSPVASLFDEIVIVDTGSGDRSREVALQFTPHVADFEWCDDFAAARNESLRRSSGDWIFWLDADDRLDPENIAKLQIILNGLGDQPRAIMMDIVSPPRDPGVEPWIVTHPRLFRRHPLLHWQGRVHEQLTPAPESLGYEAVHGGIEIEHIGYLDASLMLRKRNRKLRLLRMDFAVNPDDPSTLFHLGMAYAKIGTIREAQKYLLRLVALQPLSAPYMRRVYCALAELSAASGAYNEALQIAERGLSWFPDDEQILYVAAQILYELAQYEAAKTVLARLMTHGQTLPTYGGGSRDIKTKLAPRLLGAVLRVQLAFQEAEVTLQAVVSTFPTDVNSWYNLGLVYLDLDSGQKLATVCDRLRSCAGGDLYADLLLDTWQLRHDQLERAGLLIDKLVSDAPQMPLPRMLRVEWLSRHGAPTESQRQALNDLLRVHPGNTEGIRWLKVLDSLQPEGIAAQSNDLQTPAYLLPAAN